MGSFAPPAGGNALAALEQLTARGLLTAARRLLATPGGVPSTATYTGSVTNFTTDDIVATRANGSPFRLTTTSQNISNGRDKGVFFSVQNLPGPGLLLTWEAYGFFESSQAPLYWVNPDGAVGSVLPPGGSSVSPADYVGDTFTFYD
jgi:hypothetical protein